MASQNWIGSWRFFDPPARAMLAPAKDLMRSLEQTIER
jgi:hypothetical protein